MLWFNNDNNGSYNNFYNIHNLFDGSTSSRLINASTQSANDMDSSLYIKNDHENLCLNSFNLVNNDYSVNNSNSCSIGLKYSLYDSYNSVIDSFMMSSSYYVCVNGVNNLSLNNSVIDSFMMSSSYWLNQSFSNTSKLFL